MDFLSALTYFGINRPNDDCIILNSLSMIEGAKEKLRGYKNQKYFLDHDAAGRKALIDLVEDVGGVDASGFYSSHKDINDFLIFEKSV